MIFYPACKSLHHSSRKLVKTSWLKQLDLQSTSGHSQCNIKQSPLTCSDLNLRWMEFSVSIWTHLRPKSSASHCEGQRKLVVDTEVANISGSRLAHVPHLSRKLELPTSRNWRRPGVNLKWAGGKPGSVCGLALWLNTGIRGTTANIKTEGETYPSGTIKEGENRAVSVCEHVCVVVFQPHTLLSNTHTETVHFLNSSCQKTSNEKGTHLKRWQLLWSHICSLVY